MKYDLHVHTNRSDGIFEPTAVLDLAKQRGIDCISLTDHDTMENTDQIVAYAKQIGIGYLVGVELSCVGPGEVHILGYNIDYNAPGFAEEIAKIANMRKERNRLIVQKLAEVGCKIDLDKLESQGSVGRGVLAREMVKMGFCQSVPEVFEKYLGVGCSCYVQTKRLTPVEGIQFILRYGGIPVLAHPKQLKIPFDSFEKFLKPLVLAGLGGIEAQYFTHTKPERSFYGKMAKKYKLVVTGGSDFHDYVHGVELGTKSFVPSSYTRKILGI